MALSGRRPAAATGQAVSDRTSSRVQSGILLKPRPGLFAGAPTQIEARLERLLLDVGGPVWAAGPTAAALHGFGPYALAEPLHLLVPVGRDVSRSDVVVWQSGHTDWCDLGVRDGHPVTRPARTLIDLGRDAPARPLRLALDSGIESRLVNDHVLHRRIVALADEPGTDALHHVLERRDAEHGVCWPAAEFRRLMECHGTRRPAVEVFADRIECRWEASDVVAVVLGWKVGANPERLDQLREAGATLIVFGYDQLVLAPRDLVTATNDALRAAPPFAAAKATPRGGIAPANEGSGDDRF